MADLFTYDNFVHALAGSVANGTAMTVFYPLDTVRSRLQLEDKRKAKNTITVMGDLIREEGLLSLYRGLEPVLYSLFTSSFIYFYSFHGLRRKAGEKSAVKDLILGAAGGVINVLVTTPLWVVNTRIKMQGSKMIGDRLNSAAPNTNHVMKQQHYNGLVDGLIKISKSEGVGSLWSGTGPSLVLVSNPAIQFMIFELLKRNLKEILKKKELSSFHVFILGSISKSISTLVSYPLQIIQSKKRYGSPEIKSKSMATILFDIKEREGAAGLYKGLEAKLYQTVLTTSLMYVFYERIYSLVTGLGKSI